MGFWDSFWGTSIAHVIHDLQSDREKNKRWNENFSELVDCQAALNDYLHNLGCPTVYIADSSSLNDETLYYEKQKMENYKRKLDNYLSLGGNPSLIHDLDDLDKAIEQVKYLCSVNMLNRQSEFATLFDVDLTRKKIEAEKEEEKALQKKQRDLDSKPEISAQKMQSQSEKLREICRHQSPELPPECSSLNLQSIFDSDYGNYIYLTEALQCDPGDIESRTKLFELFKKTFSETKIASYTDKDQDALIDLINYYLLPSQIVAENGNNPSYDFTSVDIDSLLIQKRAERNTSTVEQPQEALSISDKLRQICKHQSPNPPLSCTSLNLKSIFDSDYELYIQCSDNLKRDAGDLSSRVKIFNLFTSAFKRPAALNLSSDDRERLLDLSNYYMLPYMVVSDNQDNPDFNYDNIDLDSLLLQKRRERSDKSDSNKEDISKNDLTHKIREICKSMPQNPPTGSPSFNIKNILGSNYDEYKKLSTALEKDPGDIEARTELINLFTQVLKKGDFVKTHSPEEFQSFIEFSNYYRYPITVLEERGEL